MQKKLPPIQWAQRKDRLFVTINIRDIANEKIDLKEKLISFSGLSDNQNYEASINLFKEVNPQVYYYCQTLESKWTKIGLNLQIILMKANKSESFWPRLTLEDKKFQNITVDWNRFTDEDEEEEAKEVGGPGWDPDQMNKFEQEQEDSDDEEENLNDLDQDADKKEENDEKDENKKQEEEKKEEGEKEKVEKNDQ